jgi:hypothetical protein
MQKDISAGSKDIDEKEFIVIPKNSSANIFLILFKNISLKKLLVI